GSMRDIEGRNRAAAQQLRATRVRVVEIDVTQTGSVDQGVQAAAHGMGGLTVLVNNAGWSPLTKLADQTPELIEQLYAVNAVGPTILARGAVRIMREAGAGSIVNVSSVASFDPFVGLGVYGAAKAATNTLARAIANEHGEEGIVAYTVAPGAVETELLRSIVDESMLPTEKTLSAGEVAAVIVDCALRRRSEPNGSTITIQSPG
ncbi:MAG: SDR family oxidoreductase, partial [Planctomycetota bacterium]